MDKMMQFEAGQNYFYKQVKGKVMKQSQGLYPAPLKIIDVSMRYIPYLLGIRFIGL